jgi:hypothetical protein
MPWRKTAYRCPNSSPGPRTGAATGKWSACGDIFADFLLSVLNLVCGVVRGEMGSILRSRQLEQPYLHILKKPLPSYAATLINVGATLEAS